MTLDASWRHRYIASNNRVNDKIKAGLNFAVFGGEEPFECPTYIITA
jgi:hypothetical protein